MRKYFHHTDCSSVPVELLQTLLAETNIHRWLQTLTSFIEDQFPEVRVAVFTYSPDTGTLSPTSHPSIYFHKFDPDFSIPIQPEGLTASQAAYYKKMIWTKDIRNNPASVDYQTIIDQYQLRGILSMPILSSRGELLGAFGFYYSKVLEELPPEYKFFEILTNLTALTLERNFSEKRTKSILAELQASQERLNLALQSQTMGVWDWYVQTDRLIWDKTMFEILGMDASQSLGSFADLEKRIHPDDLEPCLTAIRKAFEHGVFDHQFRIIRQNEVRYVASVGYVARDENGEPVRMTGLNWDVTDKVIANKKIEQERAKAIANSKMASLGEMASGVAHEINNPLTIILNRANQLKSRLQNPDFEKDWALLEIGKIENTVERIAKIIRGLRAFSRNADNDPMISCEFTSIVDETLELCREKFKRFGILFEINGSHESFSLRCRPSQISQVLLNLFNNSFDAIVNSQKPWIELSISLGRGTACVRITDSGHGIPTHIADKMMDPFFSTKEVGRGTGLGLSISRGIIEEHGGRLWYDRENEHTSFVLEIPIEEVTAKPIRGASTSLSQRELHSIKL